MFTTEEDFQVKFSIFYIKFCAYQETKDFIDENLVLKKEKSVAFYTKLEEGFGLMEHISTIMTLLDRCVERIYTEMFL